MPEFEFEQHIRKLEPRKGGYFYLTLSSGTIDQYEKKRHTRLVCEIDDIVTYSCGLNHLGDGNFFIIVAGKLMKKLNKREGETVRFRISEDPNPLGVEIPEVLQALLDQDTEVKSTYDHLTDGKKRSLIYTIKPVKNIDLQVKKILDFMAEEELKMARKKAKTGS